VSPNRPAPITPATFASIPAAEKDQLLSDLFALMITTVDPREVRSSHPTVQTILKGELGKCRTEKGDEWTGVVVEGLAHGIGKAEYVGGNVYEGYMLCGQRHGEGKVTVPGVEGFTETAPCWRGKPVGVSTAQMHDGTKWTSGFDKDGEEAGPILIEMPNGIIAYGKAEKGDRTGLNVEIHPDKNIIVVTEFKNGNAQNPKVFVPAG